MAAVLTTSAGSDNVPTMHRMLISRKTVSREKQEYIRGNLLLNYSNIIIEENEFRNVIQQLGINEEVTNNIVTNADKRIYYEISERFLRSIRKGNLDNLNQVELVGQLRAVSYALRYNKISKKLDENILELLKNNIII